MNKPLEHEEVEEVPQTSGMLAIFLALLLVWAVESPNHHLEDLIWIVPLCLVGAAFGLLGMLTARRRWPWLILLLAACWPFVHYRLSEYVHRNDTHKLALTAAAEEDACSGSGSDPPGPAEVAGESTLAIEVAPAFAAFNAEPRERLDATNIGTLFGEYVCHRTSIRRILLAPLAASGATMGAPAVITVCGGTTEPYSGIPRYRVRVGEVLRPVDYPRDAMFAGAAMMHSRPDGPSHQQALNTSLALVDIQRGITLAQESRTAAFAYPFMASGYCHSIPRTLLEWVERAFPARLAPAS